MKDIRIENLSKRYGDRTVLHNLSVTIPYGARVCILGPSGCGKTTLLRILLGSESPSGGSVSGIPESISPVFQEDRLCEALTALGNVKLTANTDAQVCAGILSELGLGSSVHQSISSLSGGMKRRVAIARALAHRSELLLMDEPFSGLDAAAIENADRVIRKYSEDRTLIYTVHELSEAFPGDMIINLNMPD